MIRIKLWQVVLNPFFARIKLGEGGILVFNLFYSVYVYKNTFNILIETLLSFFVLCALYGFNDYHDRNKDVLNPKKDIAFVSLIIKDQRFFIWANLFLSFCTIVFAYFFLPHYKVFLIVLLYLTNFAYSMVLKGIPIIDIIIVAIWGALYVCIAGVFEIHLVVMAGIMTGIAHLFQMMTDQYTDKENHTRTSVVAMPGQATILLGLLCVALLAALYMTLGVYWACTAVFPLAIYMVSHNISFSWYSSRIYFAICWITILNLFYGAF